MASGSWPLPCNSLYRSRAYYTFLASAKKAGDSIPATPLTTRVAPRLRGTRKALNLGNPANLYCAVLVRTIEAGYSWLLQDHPVYVICVFQPREICCAETFPRSLRLYLRPPHLGERREHADHAIIFHPVGQPAPLGQAAKSNLIFARDIHVIRIKGEHRVYGRVLPSPDKRLCTRIVCGRTGPLNVGARRKK